MNKLFSTITLLFAMILASAQAPVQKGQTQLNAGVGLSSWGFPVYVGLDFGFKPDITLGGEISARSYYDNILGTPYGHSIIGLSVNGNYHFNRILHLPSKFNLYAGANAGFYIWNSVKGYPGKGRSGVGVGGQVGIRYYFNERFGINLETGGGNAFSGGKFGISYKLIGKAKSDSK